MTLTVLTVSNGAAVTSLETNPSRPSASRKHPDAPLIGWQRYAILHTVLEKTFLRLDAMKAEIRLDEETARAVGALVRGRDQFTSDLADSVAGVIFHARHTDIQLEFLVSVSLEKFIHESEKSIEAVGDAGLLSRGDADRIAAEQAGRFAFLNGRGFKEGDNMFYEVRGDTVHMRFFDRKGVLRLEETNRDSVRRVSVLGVYLGPKSDFRKGLIKSLFED
jgi:hypothetical protein